MRERMRTIQQAQSLNWLYGLLALLVTIHYLIVYAERYLIWTGHEPIFNALRMLHALLIVLLLILCALKLRRGMPPEFWLLAAYSAWVLLTRVINRDYTLYGSLYFSAVCASVFAAGCYLPPQQRRRLLDLFSGIIGAYLFLISILGLLVWFGGNDAFPTIARFISKNPFSRIKDISFFNSAHNMSAAWFMVSFFLSAYQWTICEDRRWRAPLLLHMVIMWIMIALLHCRSIQVASCIGIGMLCVLFILPRIRKKKSYLQIAVVILTAGLGVLVCFKAMNVCGDLFVKGMTISQSEWDSYYAEQAEQEKRLAEAGIAKSSETTTPNVTQDSDSRSFLHDALTLTERTKIWEASLRLVRDDPHAALFGQAEENMMDAVNARGDYREVKQHMHNLVLQALVLTGIPGALILLAFVCLQLVRMVRAYFDTTGRVLQADKVLLILPATLLVYGMAEVLLNRLVGFASLSFLLAGGIFTEFEREAFPSR